MKSTTITITVLSVLLAATSGYILYSHVTRDKVLDDALSKTKLALDENKTLKDDKASLEIDKEKLLTSNTKKDVELKANAVLLTQQKNQIADLKASQGHAVVVADAAVAADADVETWYKAGEPVVAPIAIPALTNWFNLGGPKIDLSGSTTLQLQGEVAIMGPKIDLLTTNNLDLTISRDNLQALNDSDKIVIDNQDATILDMSKVISAQELNLTGAKTDLQTVINNDKLMQILLFTAGVIIVSETGYIVGHAALHWW